MIAQTIGDMKAVATSARVTYPEYQNFTSDFSQLRADEQLPGASAYDDPDPETYYAQHLLGFFRGSADQRSVDKSQLRSDLKSIPSASGASASGQAAVHRDAQLLQKLGAALPSDSNSALLAGYVNAFALGAPTPGDLTQLQSALVTALGTTASRARVSSVKRLITDAPAFYQGVGSSAANVQTVADDVQAVVNDGVGSTPDPFRITLHLG